MSRSRRADAAPPFPPPEVDIDPEHRAIKRSLRESLEEHRRLLEQLEQQPDVDTEESEQNGAPRNRRVTDQPHHPMRRASDLW